MTTEIRRLTKEDLTSFWEVVAGATPGVQFSRQHKDRRVQWFETLIDSYQEFGYYGLFRADELHGGMAILDLSMQLRSQQVKACGVGMISVSLLHKKEKVCRDMMQYFLRSAADRGAHMAVLFPFRSDFYRQMGFGYGAQVYQYRLKPSTFPKCETKEHLCFVGEEDKQALLECFDQHHRRTNGSLSKTWFGILEMFAPDKRIVAYKKDGVIKGYMVIGFERVRAACETPTNLIIEELVYCSPKALRQMLTFVNSQADQVDRVIINTQDGAFGLLFGDPTNGESATFNNNYLETSVVGIGAMYRVTDVKGLFHDLANHQFQRSDFTVRFDIYDSFLPENNGDVLVRFKDGFATVIDNGAPDVAISMDMAEFSSLIVGAADFEWLHDHGLAQISDVRCVEEIDRVFGGTRKPQCHTHF